MNVESQPYLLTPFLDPCFPFPLQISPNLTQPHLWDQRTPSSTYVWLDVMAANHHSGRKDKKELPHCK